MFVNQQMAKRNSNWRIVIKSSDNDVLLLSLHFYSKMTNIDELWFQSGSITSVKDGRRFIPMHDLYNSLGAEMANILLPDWVRHNVILFRYWQEDSLQNS
jgi:hypothetical protein